MIHKEEHPLAGKTVRIAADAHELAGQEYHVEDWWDRVSGKSWMFAAGNPACIHYAMRTGLSGKEIPVDNEVLYGKVGPFGKLVHISEIEVPTEQPEVAI